MNRWVRTRIIACLLGGLACAPVVAQEHWGDTLIEADFEGGLPDGWRVGETGAARGVVGWEITDAPAVKDSRGRTPSGWGTPGKVAWVHAFGQNDYDAGASRSYLITPRFTVRGRGNILSFRSYEDAERASDSRRNNYDRRQIWIAINGKWHRLSKSTLDSFEKNRFERVWVSLDQLQRFDSTVDMSQGVTVTLLFDFYTVDATDNAHTGWIIDDVRVFRHDVPFITGANAWSYDGSLGDPGHGYDPSLQFGMVTLGAASDPDLRFVDPMTHRQAEPPVLYQTHVDAAGGVALQRSRLGGTWTPVASWASGNTLTANAAFRPRLIETGQGQLTVLAAGVDGALYRRTLDWTTGTSGSWRQMSSVAGMSGLTWFAVHSEIAVTQRLTRDAHSAQLTFHNHVAYLSRAAGYWYLVYIAFDAQTTQRVQSTRLFTVQSHDVFSLKLTSGQSQVMAAYTVRQTSGGRRSVYVRSGTTNGALSLRAIFTNKDYASGITASIGLGYLGKRFHLFYGRLVAGQGWRIRHARFDATSTLTYRGSNTVGVWRQGAYVGIDDQPGFAVTMLQRAQVHLDGQLRPAAVDMQARELVLSFRSRYDNLVTMRWDKVTGWWGVGESWSDKITVTPPPAMQRIVPITASWARSYNTQGIRMDIESVLMLQGGGTVLYTSLVRSLVNRRFKTVSLGLEHVGTDNMDPSYSGDNGGRPGYPSLTQPKELLPIGTSTLQALWVYPEWIMDDVFYFIQHSTSNGQVKVACLPTQANYTNYKRSFAPAWGYTAGWASAELLAHIVWAPIKGRYDDKFWSGQLTTADWDSYIDTVEDTLVQGSESGSLDHILHPVATGFYFSGQDLRNFLGGLNTGWWRQVRSGKQNSDLQPAYDWLKDNIYNGVEFLNQGVIR